MDDGLGRIQVSSFRTAFARGIAGLVGGAIAVSYLDRQTLPWAIKAVQAGIPISNQVKAALDSLFLLAYGLMYLGGGWLLDHGYRYTPVLTIAASPHLIAFAMICVAVPRLQLLSFEKTTPRSA